MQCSRCGRNLERSHQNSLTWSLACTLSGLVFYLILVTAPFLEVALYDRFQQSSVTTGLRILGNEGFSFIAYVILVTVLFMPFMKLCGLLIVLTSLHLQHPPRWIVPLFRNLKFIYVWSMAEIYLLGFLAAYTRLQSLVHVYLELAVFALIGLILSMVSIDTTFDPEAVWRKIGEKGLSHIENDPEKHDALTGCPICHQANGSENPTCMRCDALLEHRKPKSIERTWALMLGALLLYIPANALSFLQVTQIDRTQSYTIFGGVEEFLRAGIWPLALLVFTASIVIPLFKLVTLAFLLVSTKSKSHAHLTARTRLYRFIDFIGRWSMIDIFMLSILVGLVHFGRLAQITSGTGAVCFAAVVILTMFAVSSFDPRLMWDAAEDSDNSQKSSESR